MKAIYHVFRNATGEWQTCREGHTISLGRSTEKSEILDEARRIAKWHGPSAVVIHDDSGKIETVEEFGNDALGIGFRLS